MSDHPSDWKSKWRIDRDIPRDKHSSRYHQEDKHSVRRYRSRSGSYHRRKPSYSHRNPKNPRENLEYDAQILENRPPSSSFQRHSSNNNHHHNSKRYDEPEPLRRTQSSPFPKCHTASRHDPHRSLQKFTPLQRAGLDSPVSVPLFSAETAKLSVQSGESVSIEHLQATRNVTIIDTNEYPLSFLKRTNVQIDRARLKNPSFDATQPTVCASQRRKQIKAALEEDEEVAHCYCTYPTATEREQENEDIWRCNDVSCLNFATYVECSSACAAREFCQNKRLQQPNNFPTLEAFKTLNKGFGVRAKEDVAHGSVVGEYVGEIIDEEELNNRLEAVGRHELNHYYLILKQGIYIDARRRGSLTRFVNHSCNPNCKTEKWTVCGETKIAVIALCDIPKGVELTFDYQWKSLGSQQITCYCEASNCKGVIGEAKSEDSEQSEDEHGYFREPNERERGKLLIGRKIRILPEISHVSTFIVAVIREFHADTDRYDVVYEKEDEDMASVPTDKPASISLEDLHGRWHIFCPLNGLSSDQIEAQVFSIPKLRTKQHVMPLQPSSDADLKRLSPLSQTPKRYEDSKSNHSIHVLFKGIPRRCDQPKLLQLLQIHAKAQNSANTDAIKSVQLVFHEFEKCGTALATFRSLQTAKWIVEKLHDRPLYDSILRVRFCGSQSILSFKRSQRCCVEKTEDRTSTESRASSSEKETKANEQCFCYGQRLSWLCPIQDTDALGQKMRLRSVRIMLVMANQLEIQRSNDITASAVISLHRYLHLHGMNVHKIEMTAVAFLFLFAKAYGLRPSIETFSQVFFDCKAACALAPDLENAMRRREIRVEPQELLAFSWQVRSCEMQVLKGICFDISEYPVFSSLRLVLEKEKAFKAVVSEEMRRNAEFLTWHALQSSVWIHFPLECILFSVIYLAIAVNEAFALSTYKNIAEMPRIHARNAEMFKSCCDYLIPKLQEAWDVLKRKNGSNQGHGIATYAVDKRPARVETILTLVEKCCESDIGPCVSFSDVQRLCKSAEDRSASTHRAFSPLQGNMDTQALSISSVLGVERVRKRAYLGTLSPSTPCDLANVSLYFQPWPYREQALYDTEKQGVDPCALMELSNTLFLTHKAPQSFISLQTILFPSDSEPEKAQTISVSKYYFGYEQPLHTVSGLLESRARLPKQLEKKILFDLLTALQVCHKNGMVHRSVCTAHALVFAHAMKLGGYHTMRRAYGQDRAEADASKGFYMMEYERKELCIGSLLHFTAPEIIIGERCYTWHADIWAAGCVFMDILLENKSLFQGNSPRTHLDSVYHVCGSADVEFPRAKELPLYRSFASKHLGSSRLAQLLREHKRRQLEPMAIDVLTQMLCLDPSNRRSASALLEMEYFAEIRNNESYDFQGFASSFAVQKKRLSQSYHAKAKREEPLKDPNRHDEENPSLPSFLQGPKLFQDAKKRLGTEDSDQKTVAYEKRVKLGWGMGLHSKHR